MKKLDSVVLILSGVAVGVVCGAGLAFAEERRMMAGSDSMPPPPPNSGQMGGGQMMPPPPGMPESRGMIEGQQNGQREMRDRSGPQGDMMRVQMGGQRGFEKRGMMGDGEEMGGNSAEMEKRMEEQEKRMQQEQLRQMKRGMVGGFEQGLTQIKKMVDKLSKKGIVIPADTQSLISELSAALEKVKTATELTEEVEAAIEVIQDKGHDLGDVGQKLGMLEQMAQMTKQVEKEFARIDKEVAKAKKSKNASQYPEIIAKIEGEAGALKSTWESVKSGILSGDSDPEDLREAMEEIFGQIGDVRHGIGLLQQLSSISKMVKTAEKEISRFDKEIARQKKAGKDLSKLDSLLAAARTKFAEITALSKQSTLDPEDLFDLMQELEHIRNQAVDEFDRVNGKGETKALSAAVFQAIEARRLGF